MAHQLAAVAAGRETCDTILEVNGGGLALFDGDGDGDLEILVVSPGPYPLPGAAGGGTNKLYRNDGAMVFVDVTTGSGVDVPGFCNGVAIGDVDGDGLRDVYLTRLGANLLLRNLGELRFQDLPGAAGAAGGADEWSTSAVFVDYDLDGDADLYVANYLAFDPADPPLDGQGGRRCTWEGLTVMCGPEGLPAQADRFFRNDGGRFIDVTAEAGLDVRPSYALGVIDGDFDADGWPDLYVTNDSMPNFLFLHRGPGGPPGFREAGMLGGAALSARGREQASMGLAAGDIDQDGDEDLVTTSFSMEPNALYRNAGGGRFQDQAGPAGLAGASLPMLGWGAGFLDADLDGDLDLLVANGHVYPQADAPGTDTSWAQADQLFLNDGSGGFVEVAWAGQAPAISRALALGDLDDDGVTDAVILRRSGSPLVFRGTGAGRTSLQVRVVGPPGNPDGVGSTLRFRDAQGLRSARVRVSRGYQAMGDPRVTFAWRGPGQLEIVAPDGARSERAVASPGALAVELLP